MSMPIAARISLYLAIAATCASNLLTARATSLPWWVRLYFCLPVAFTLIPWGWRSRWAPITAAAVLTASAVFPSVMLMGLFLPAALSMVVAALGALKPREPEMIGWPTFLRILLTVGLSIGLAALVWRILALELRSKQPERHGCLAGVVKENGDTAYFSGNNPQDCESYLKRAPKK